MTCPNCEAWQEAHDAQVERAMRERMVLEDEVRMLRDHYNDILSAAEDVRGFWGVEGDPGLQEAMRDMARAIDVAREREREAERSVAFNRRDSQ